MRNNDLLLYHPTFIGAVDDSPEFCDSFESALQEEGLRAKAFTDPYNFLSYLKKEPCPAEWVWKEWTGHNAYVLEQKTFLKILAQKNRYAMTSILIADLRMPVMDGLTLFKELPLEKPLRKVMLTGTQSYQDAIEHLNEGTIDCFVGKGSRDAMERVLSLIPLQTELFFKALYRRYMGKLNRKIIESRPYQALFQDEMEQGFFSSPMIEYCTLCTRGSRFFIDQKGKTSALLIYEGSDFDLMAEDMAQKGASTADVEKIKQRKLAPAFSFWDIKLPPLHKVRGNCDSTFYYSRLNEKELGFLGLELSSFDDYLKSLG